MSTFKYRLQPLLDQKVRLKEQAEEALGEKQKQLRLAFEKLEELRAAEQALVLKKQTQRRNLLAGSGQSLSGGEIGRRCEYLQSLTLDLDAAKDAIFAQQLFIDECKEQVEVARKHLAKCSRDVETLEKHREKLQQRFQRELDRKEAIELDEIGNMLYTRRQNYT